MEIPKVKKLTEDQKHDLLRANITAAKKKRRYPKTKVVFRQRNVDGTTFEFKNRKNYKAMLRALQSRENYRPFRVTTQYVDHGHSTQTVYKTVEFLQINNGGQVEHHK